MGGPRASLARRMARHTHRERGFIQGAAQTGTRLTRGGSIARDSTPSHGRGAPRGRPQRVSATRETPPAFCVVTLVRLRGKAVVEVSVGPTRATHYPLLSDARPTSAHTRTHTHHPVYTLTNFFLLICTNSHAPHSPFPKVYCAFILPYRRAFCCPPSCCESPPPRCAHPCPCPPSPRALPSPRQ